MYFFTWRCSLVSKIEHPEAAISSLLPSTHYILFLRIFYCAIIGRQYIINTVARKRLFSPSPKKNYEKKNKRRRIIHQSELSAIPFRLLGYISLKRRHPSRPPRCNVSVVVLVKEDRERFNPALL